MNKNELEKTLDIFTSCGAKYKHDADFRQKIDSNSVDLKESFGIDIDKEIEFKVNTDDIFYVIIEEDKNQAIGDDEHLSNITGAKAGKYVDTTFKQAQTVIGALGATGFLNVFTLLALKLYANDLGDDHPEYFRDGLIKTEAEYLAGL